jgi:hypothetical protein
MNNTISEHGIVPSVVVLDAAVPGAVAPGAAVPGAVVTISAPVTGGGEDIKDLINRLADSEVSGVVRMDDTQSLL